MEGESRASRSAASSPPSSCASAATPSASAALRLRSRWVALRSLLVGSLATVFDLGTLALLVHGAGLDPRVASVPALVLGVGLQFVGNKLFAFQDQRRDWARQGLQFLAVEALGVCCNLALFHLAVSLTNLPIIPLRLAITSAVYFGVCLPLWGKIFQAESAAQ